MTRAAKKISFFYLAVIFVTFGIIFFANTNIVWAAASECQEFKGIIPLEVHIGDTKAITGNIKVYIVVVYKFLLGAVGIIAAVKIIIAGVNWVLAAGSSEKIKEAQENLSSAIWGLVIALIATFLLGAINTPLATFNTDICAKGIQTDGFPCSDDMPCPKGKDPVTNKPFYQCINGVCSGGWEGSVCEGDNNCPDTKEYDMKCVNNKCAKGDKIRLKCEGTTYGECEYNQKCVYHKPDPRATFYYYQCE